MVDSLRVLFATGYTSGDILADVPDAERARQEAQIRGSYRDAFGRAVRPYLRPDSRVLELGPGRGSWTRAILACIPDGAIHVVDPVDVRPWMPDDSRVVVHAGSGADLGFLLRRGFDFVFSFGVLCHCARREREAILAATLGVARPGGIAVHQYGDWDKLDALGWGEGCAPREFRDLSDDAIWWPRNNVAAMAAEATTAGWRVRVADVGVFGRDSICILEAP